MITWITRNVAIGEYSDAINEELLEKEKIDCVLNVRAKDEVNMVEQTIEMFHGIKYFHVSVGSRQGVDPIKIELRTASFMLELLVKKYKRILVHCMAGIDRSPFVVASWLANKEYYRLDIKDQFYEAYKDIKKKRPQIIEHMEWV